MPYKMIEGVYVKHIYDYNNFPVYRRERDNLIFYYSKTKYGYYVFGLSYKHSFGVAAKVFGFSNPTAWPASGSLNRNDVFEGLVRYWLYYDKRGFRWRRVQSSSSSPMIKAVCVDEDFRECNSDRVYLNESFTDGRGNTLNDPAQHYFFRKPGMFRNLRPVYEHSKQSWYLQYVDGYWVVTAAYLPRNSKDQAYMRVKDPALRPEFISKTWSIKFIYSGWRDRAKLRVLCRGVTAMSNSCPSKPCHGNATCVYTSRNDTLCLCPPGYTGVKCSVNKQCPTPTPIGGKELSVVYHGKRPGDLGVSLLVCHFAVLSTTPLSGFLSVSMAGTIHYGKGEGSHVEVYQTRQPRTLEDLGTLPLRIHGSLVHQVLQVQETPGTPVEYQPTILGGARKLTQPKVVLGLELIVLIKARARKGLITVVL